MIKILSEEEEQIIEETVDKKIFEEVMLKYKLLKKEKTLAKRKKKFWTMRNYKFPYTFPFSSHQIY